MTKEQIQKEIKGMDSYIPVSKIEQKLKMPPTTLQKVLKGQRVLPKKWYKVLENYFIKKEPTKNKMVVVTDLTQLTNVAINTGWEEKQHPKYQNGDPREGSNGFYLKYGVFYYNEIEN